MINNIKTIVYHRTLWCIYQRNLSSSSSPVIYITTSLSDVTILKSYLLYFLRIFLRKRAILNHLNIIKKRPITLCIANSRVAGLFETICLIVNYCLFTNFLA